MENLMTDEELAASLEHVRQTAWGLYDLVKWFEMHPEVFGITELSGVADISVTEEYQNVVGFMPDESNPEARQEIDFTMKVTYAKPSHPLLTNRFKASTENSIIQESKIPLVLAYKDWPFLICKLAGTVLFNEFVHFDAQRAAQVEQLLTQYIPHHFPGMSWDALRALHAADLITVEKNKGYHETVADILFSRANKTATLTLPDTLIQSTPDSP